MPQPSPIDSQRHTLNVELARRSLLIKNTIPKLRPLVGACSYKGAKGGRSSGKSHFFAEQLVDRHIRYKNFCSVCIREVQKSLKYSAKKLVEAKIRASGFSHLFNITATEITRIGGDGVMIFQGMQDHTADSIKSLEGFDLAWCEEAQSLSARSIDLLLPTIRKDGSEVWFSWNPEQDSDPVEVLFSAAANDPDYRVCHVNYTENPHCPSKAKDLAKAWEKKNPDTFDHVWLGGYNTKADDQVLMGCCRIDEFEPAENWDGPYYGGDWGFSTDPNSLVKAWVAGNTLYIEREAYGNGIEIDDTPSFFKRVEGSDKHTVRCDSARPELISHMQRHGYPRVIAATKWPGSVEDGISKLRSFDAIVIHPQCPHTIDESRLWKYKRDRLTGDVLPKLIKGNDHCWDAIRYAIGPLIKAEQVAAAW